MLSVPARSRLVLRGPGGERGELRTLATTRVNPSGLIPVLASPAAQAIGAGTVELSGAHGSVTVNARLRRGTGELELTLPDADLSGSTARRSTGQLPSQRRNDVRGRVELPLYGTATAERTAPGGGAPPLLHVSGVTVDVSAGGVRAVVDPSTGPVLRELFVELDRGGPRPVHVVLDVVAQRSGLLQARFVVIDPGDREYLARRVFAVHRAELAARRTRP